MVACAYDILEEEGLQGLTIRAVLKRTGLARRAFYERFASKDDLMLAVFEQTIRHAADHYAAQVASMPDPMERLRLIVTCIVLASPDLGDADVSYRGRRAAALSREHLRLAESHPHDLQSALRPLIALIARQLESGIAAGVIRNHNPHRLAALVYNLVSTTVHAQLLAEEAAPAGRTQRDQLAVEIWEFCRRAIAA